MVSTNIFLFSVKRFFYLPGDTVCFSGDNVYFVSKKIEEYCMRLYDKNKQLKHLSLRVIMTLLFAKSDISYMAEEKKLLM